MKTQATTIAATPEWSAATGFSNTWHLDGLKPDWQISVIGVGPIVICSVFHPGSGDEGVKTEHATVAIACTYGESQAASLDAYDDLQAAA